MTWLYVGLGGAAGTLARFIVSRYLAARTGATWPLGTLAVNLSGTFFLGLILGLPEGRLPSHVTLLLTTGFLGAYTTFSTLAYEIITLAEEGENSRAFAYFAASLVPGLLLAWAGWLLARSL